MLRLDLAIRVTVLCIRVRHEFTLHEFAKHEHDTNYNSCLAYETQIRHDPNSCNTCQPLKYGFRSNKPYSRTSPPSSSSSLSPSASRTTCTATPHHSVSLKSGINGFTIPISSTGSFPPALSVIDGFLEPSFFSFSCMNSNRKHHNSGTYLVVVLRNRHLPRLQQDWSKFSKNLMISGVAFVRQEGSGLRYNENANYCVVLRLNLALIKGYSCHFSRLINNGTAFNQEPLFSFLPHAHRLLPSRDSTSSRIHGILKNHIESIPHKPLNTD
ncbi:hypothetical protein LXL04_021927 [Taraxacum kok-saghyz]